MTAPSRPAKPARYDAPIEKPGRTPRVKHGLDACALLCLYVGLLMILPARLVLAGIGFDVTPSLMLAFGLGLWWGCAQLTSSLGAAKGKNMVRTGLFLFLAANLATYSAATYDFLPYDELRAADRSTMTIVGVIMIGILVVDGVRSWDRLNTLLLFTVNTGTVVAIFGMLQFFVNVNIPAVFERIPGLRATFPLTLVLDRAIFRRPAGTAGHPIEFGVIMACLLPIAVHFAFRAQAAKAAGTFSPGGRWPAWRWTCVLLLAVASFVSVSRSAIVGLIAGGLVLIPTWPPKRRLQTMVTVVVFVGMMRLLVHGLVGTLLSLFLNFGNDDSIEGRTQDYATVSSSIAHHLIFGRGFGTYLPDKYGPLDNQYLGSLVETGLIGLLTLLASMLVAIAAARRVRRMSVDPAIRDLGQSMVAAVVILLVAYVTFDAFAFAICTGLTFLLIGVCGAMLRIARAEAEARPAARPPARPAGRST
jgi:O-antigen ligase